MRQKNLVWIHSAGGPLVLLQSSTLRLWRGVQGHDYADASSFSGYTGVLRKEGRDILVLADEPLETAYQETDHGQFLVQWSYAPDENSVVDALAAIRHAALGTLAEVFLDIDDQQQTLIDAGASGLDARERLIVNLAPGHYKVRTSAYRPSNEVELIIHELVRA